MIWSKNKAKILETVLEELDEGDTVFFESEGALPLATADKKVS